jgi:hypothetical protein
MRADETTELNRPLVSIRVKEFALRILVLILLLGIVAGVEWYLGRSRATRWREYAFLGGCALFGGLFGVAVDQVTARIAPEYFWIGKGIDAGEDFWPDVLALGFQAGFIAGAFIGGLLLVANSISNAQAPLRFAKLARFIGLPLAAGLLAALVGALLIPRWDPMNLRDQLTRTLDEGELNRFLIVWGIHLGLYVGGLAGAGAAAVWIWRVRAPKSA